MKSYLFHNYSTCFIFNTKYELKGNDYVAFHSSQLYCILCKTNTEMPRVLAFANDSTGDCETLGTLLLKSGWDERDTSGVGVLF